MKEVKYVKELFDERFNTKGRSVALINNLNTIETLPIASKSNLSLVLQQIGKMINPDEDILFLYLTSHGSRQQKLSVDFVPLSLNSIEPHQLKTIIKNSGIKYSILVVSACYSGGFMEQLKDEYTLIVTSSAINKQSFGCSNESNFTYLGKAIFDEQLKYSYDFIASFNKAILSIKRREKLENREPSEPQLFIGEKIKHKLEDIPKSFDKSYYEYNRFTGDIY